MMLTKLLLSQMTKTEWIKCPDLDWDKPMPFPVNEYQLFFEKDLGILKAKWDSNEKCWILNEIRNRASLDRFRPTHWMPLPEVPND